MNNQATKRILSILLAALLGVFTAAPPMTAYAAGSIKMQEGMPQITYATNGVNANTVTVVGFAGHEWYVIGYDGSGVESDNDTMTLLAKNYEFGTTKFNSAGSSSKYDGSALHTAMQELYTTLFTDADAKEKGLVLKRKLNGVWDGTDNARLNYNGTLADQYIWPLSYEEAAALNDPNKADTVMAFGDHWWLRSPGYSDTIAAAVGDNGGINGIGITVFSAIYAIRPAFKLNLESVIFTSAASDGKSVTVGDTSLSAAEPTTGAVKLTVKDSGQNLNVIANADQENQSGVSDLTFSYENATFAADKQYISCFLENNDPSNDDYYGKLIKTTDASEANGTLSIPLTDVDDGTYTLKIFSEQANGDNFTDFCSDPVTMTVTVDTNGNGTVSGFNGTVDNAKPTVTGVSPSGTDVSTTAASLELTFSKKIDIATAGTVTMSPDKITGTPNFTSDSLWDIGHKALTIPISGLDYSETYSISVSGFQDVAGNVMDMDTDHSFATMAQPDGPYASGLSPAVLDLNGTKTGTFTVSLGQNGNHVDSATITSSDTDVATVDTPTINGDDTITVTGVGVGRAIISIGFSGGPADGKTDTVNVQVVDTTSATPDTPTPAPGRSNSGSGGSGSRQNTVTVQPRPVTMSEALAAYNTALAAKDADSTEITVRLRGWFSEISLEIQQAIAKKAEEDGVSVRFQVSQVQNLNLVARVTFNPAEATGTIALTPSADNPSAVNTAAKFRKWFGNKLIAVFTGQTGSYGQPVEIVVNPDLTGMDTENLVFCSYDKATNTYKRIEKPAYWIDKNGYLHFTTELSGDIIISEGSLERKQL